MSLSAVLLALSFGLDAPTAHFLELGSSGFARNLAKWASKAGEGWVIAVAGATFSSMLFLGRRFQAGRAVFSVATIGLLTGAAATILRSLLGRTRPDAQELQGFYGVWHDSHWIIGKYEFGAFPSGHVATVVGLATAAWLIDRRFGVLALVYALLVSWSRIAMGCHHFSDTVAAAILGIFGANLLLMPLQPVLLGLGKWLQDTWLTWRNHPRSPASG